MQILTASGINLHAVRSGAGAAVILLHGITDSGTCWGRLHAALAIKHDVLALDARGHGESDAPLHGYGTDMQVADALAAIGNMQSPVLLIGHSFGAFNALALAARHPRLVQRLVLIDPPFRDEHAAADKQAEERFAWFEWLRVLQTFEHDQQVTVGKRQSPAWSDAEVIAWALAKQRCSPHVWGHNGISRLRDWRSHIPLVQCPSLLIYGDPKLGSIVDDARAAQVKAINPCFDVTCIPEAGHSVHRDQFEATWASLSAWLARNLQET